MLVYPRWSSSTWTSAEREWGSTLKGFTNIHRGNQGLLGSLSGAGLPLVALLQPPSTASQSFSSQFNHLSLSASQKFSSQDTFSSGRCQLVETGFLGLLPPACCLRVRDATDSTGQIGSLVSIEMPGLRPAQPAATPAFAGNILFNMLTANRIFRDFSS